MGFLMDDWDKEPELTPEEIEELQRRHHEEMLYRERGLQIIPVEETETPARTPTPDEIQDIIDSFDEPVAPEPQKPYLH